jgi:hypothetical protein
VVFRQAQQLVAALFAQDRAGRILHGWDGVDRDSPDESQTGINVRVFPALLQDRREVLTATSISGNPNLPTFSGGASWKVPGGDMDGKAPPDASAGRAVGIGIGSDVLATGGSGVPGARATFMKGSACRAVSYACRAASPGIGADHFPSIPLIILGFEISEELRHLDRRLTDSGDHEVAR